MNAPTRTYIELKKRSCIICSIEQFASVQAWSNGDIGGGVVHRISSYEAQSMLHHMVERVKDSWGKKVFFK